ncbi:kinetochore protein SPC25 homolog isoform X2 [Rhododendron vialii]|uniref:kinetochore protein SPC25 homolog isoform X2 n=1 Tax=Rhododendron vialii TaxID=182163 RepID=UPI00265F09AD|nr:kinetochore protein SPC25 homolog isoform X2 [Rhododendron vialii]XP_058194127.1 kinetochore protein SPC25 homolog isoform X2 [Rhododendron vialii]XP_058194128.1 kinetochore protein SPC25 homolog isoform X2 [Rhododendron vialii]
MQSRIESSVRTKMEELRLVCGREIPIQQQRMDASVVAFQKSLESTKAKAQETVENQEKLGKLKLELRKAEDDLVKALAVKTRKEAKQMTTMDSLSATRARIEELKRIVKDQKARKNEYAAIISQQSEVLSTCEDKRNKNDEDRGGIEEAILWYNRVLGFRIECGHGVKFMFSNINVKNPKEEYSLSIRHENDVYTLLDCDPRVNDSKELIHELNRTNGLFKFVRAMREKFQEAAAQGISPQASSIDQDSSTISVSAPVSSISTDSQSESLPKKKENEVEETKRRSKKVNYATGGKPAILSPGSALSFRRSPRFKVKK